VHSFCFLEYSYLFAQHEAYGGMDLQLHSFLILALCWGGWSPSRSRRFNPEERALIRWDGSHKILGALEKN